jgi:SNF2 family DNA or RNA helicase
VDFARARARAALFLATGLGKTRVGLELLAGTRGVVVAPLTTLLTWEAEAAKWGYAPPRLFTGNKRTLQLQAWAMSQSDWLIVPYSRLAEFARLCTTHIPVLIFDEAQFVKNWTAQRTKSAFALSKRAGRVYVLSGTPITNSLADTYGVYKPLGVWPESWWAFKNKYFTVGHFNEICAPKPGAEREILARVSPYTLIITREQVGMNLPLVLEECPLPPSDEERGFYNQIVREHRINSPQNAFISFLTASKILAGLRTACDGIVYHSAFGSVEQSAEVLIPVDRLTKTRALVELLEASEVPTIIWVEWQAIQSSLPRYLLEKGFPVVEGTSHERVSRFLDKKAGILVVNPRVGGIGLNLQFAPRQIFFDLTDDLALYQQAIARSHRQGATRTVEVSVLYLAGTVEQKILRCLKAKRTLQETIYEVLQELQEKGEE